MTAANNGLNESKSFLLTAGLQTLAIRSAPPDKTDDSSPAPDKPAL
jgi:hypothetical protein